MDFFSGVFDWFKSSSITSSLAKVALLGYASRLLTNSNKPVSTGNNTIVDAGVRLQLNPDTENKIPVLYGEAYFGGYITDAQLSSNYKKMTYCLTLAELTGTQLSGDPSTYFFEGVYVNNNRVVFKSDGVTVNYTLDSSGNQDISLRDLVKIYFYCDQTGVQPVGHTGTTPSPFTTMPGWSSDTHSMEDLMYAIVDVTYSRDAGVSGLPNLTFNIRNSMTLVGDVLYDYMTNSVYGAGIPSGEIDSTSLTALNAYCTTGFTYTALGGGSATSTITVNGLVDTSTEVLTNMQALAEAGSSWISYDIHTGTWRVIINQAGTSSASFTDSNIIGEISLSGTSLVELVNVSDVKYQNTDILDKTDFVKISIPSGSLFANETRKSLQVNLPFTNKQVVAAKIGLQALKQGRVDKIITFTADYSYILLGAGELISVTSQVYGFTNKLFRIITVTQTEGDLGEIQLSFTALEYDAAVYTYNISEFLVESDNGILGIGSIGKPNVPTVTKIEESNLPQIIINAEVPSGIVDAMEYWITFDVGVGNDSARTYVKVGEFSNTTGSPLNEDDTASYTYTGLQQSDFFVKVRGVNNLTTGPYSDPTGLIEYKPVVVADTVSNEPVIGLGGQLMTLGLLALLNNLDGLYRGLFGDGSLLDKILDGIKEATGVDLKTGGPGVPGVDGQDGKDAGVPFLAFGPNQYPKDRDTLENPETPFPNVQPRGGPDDPNTVRLSGTLADHADPNGDYYFSISTSTQILVGSGDIKLYKSDGTLVQTLSASSLIIDNVNKIVRIPFATRQNKTDFYILMDQGVVKGANGALSRAIDKPETWNFHTDTPSPRPKLEPVPTGTVIRNCPPLRLVSVVVKLFEDKIAPDNQKTDIETNIVVVWNQSIKLAQSGTITINSASGVYQSFDLSKTFGNDKISNELVVAQGNRLYINPTVDFPRGTTFWINITSNAILVGCNTTGNAAITDNTTIRWTTDNGPVGTSRLPAGNENANGGSLGLKFPNNVNRGTGNINIKDSSGTTVKSIPGTDPAITIVDLPV